MKENTSKIHYEILDHKRLNLLDGLAPLTKDFILAGGTALVLQINHRQSFDFDFFSEKEISLSLLVQLKSLVEISTVIINNLDELSLMTKDDIKLSFIYYPFEIKASSELNNGVKLFSVADIAAQKAYTIGRRGAYRDYFDIYSLLQGNYLTLKEIIENAKKIYGEIFNPKLFLEQLVYFDDLNNFEIIPVDKNQKLPSSNEVHEFLETTIKDYLSNLP